MLASEETLRLISAKIQGGLSTIQTVVTDILSSIAMGVYRTTPPAGAATGNAVPLQVDKYGNLHVAGTIRHFVPYTPSIADVAAGPCDGVMVTTANDQLALQGAETPLLVTNGDFAASTGWTVGAGWAIGSGVATATNSSAALSQTICVVGQKYLVTFTIGGTPAGTLTATCGTGAGTGYTTVGTKQEVITCATTGVFALTGTGFTGTIDNVSVIPLTPPIPSAGQWHPMSAIKVAAVVQDTSIVTNSPVYLGWYRYPTA